MTDRDDGEADDPALQSLRAVWLAMPDEEPPQRGLAELMAAARVKAEQMAAPTLWQRITALLRRPPVLALATVLVLIGGAVFIGQRKDTMEAEHVVSSAPRSAEPPAPASSLAPGSAAGEQAPMLAEPMIPEPTFEAEPPPLAQPVVTRRPPPPKKARVDTAIAVPQEDRGRLAVEASDADDKSFEEGTRGRDIAKPAKARASEASDSFAAPDGKAGKDERVGGAAPPAASEAPETTASPSSSRGASATRAPTTQPSPPPSRVAQDLALAKAAAARGDCTTARTLMKRVASEDAVAYRKALASDAPLKSCVVVAK